LPSSFTPQAGESAGSIVRGRVQRPSYVVCPSLMAFRHGSKSGYWMQCRGILAEAEV
jgi:hypothetical protein